MWDDDDKLSGGAITANGIAAKLWPRTQATGALSLTKSQCVTVTGTGMQSLLSDVVLKAEVRKFGK